MSRPKRIPGYSYVGVQRYFITTCTHERAEHFTGKAIVDPVVDQFLRTAQEFEISIVAYCVMPDHIHLLVDGQHDGAELLPFMKMAKQRTGYDFKQRTGKRLWQAGYFEHVLRDEERTEDVVFYIVANPIRKHLVENVLDYPFWGSQLYSREDLLRSIGLRQT